MRDDLPDDYDVTKFAVSVKLPARPLTTKQVIGHVYGVRIEDGAKPWPYYRDAETSQWWLLNEPTTGAVISALVWIIELDQLAYKSDEDAEEFLESVLPELAKRAEQFGGIAEPECSVAEAIEKMKRADAFTQVRDHQSGIVIAASNECSVKKWWHALEEAGLEHGDGDLFWLYNESEGDSEDDSDDDFEGYENDLEEDSDEDSGDDFEDGGEPKELFCAEPYTADGDIAYFHPGDLKGKTAFPGIVLHFRVNEFKVPLPILRRMAVAAEKIADSVGAILLTYDDEPFDLLRAERELEQVQNDFRIMSEAVANIE